MLWSSPSDWHKIEVVPLGTDISGWSPGTFREHPAPFELISVGRLTDVRATLFCWMRSHFWLPKVEMFVCVWLAMDRTAVNCKRERGNLESPLRSSSKAGKARKNCATLRRKRPMRAFQFSEGKVFR